MPSVATPIAEPRGPLAHAEGPVVPNSQLAMAAVIVSELMLFAGLIGSYLVFRLQVTDWPPAGQPRLPIAVTAANSVVLVASAVVLRRGLALLRQGIADRAGRTMTVAAILGATFLAVQGAEWVHLVQHGLTLGSSVFGGTFYLIIGCHAVHVAVAVLFLAVVTTAVRWSWLSPERLAPVEACTAYWYFVTGLWLVLFPLLYLY
jgi:cytochrome c oxidase subunit 3